MKPNHLILTLTLMLSLIVGCSDDATPDKCIKTDSEKCSTDFATCTAACVADEACLRKCQVTFCDCLDQASCDPPAECKIETKKDSGPAGDGKVANKDGAAGDKGQTPDDDSTIKPDLPLGECTQAQSTACSTTLASCSAGCGANESCYKTCQFTFCDCMEAAGCQVDPDCKNV